MKFGPSYLFLALLVVTTSACVSSGEGDAIRKDLYGAKKRLLELEAIVSKTDKESRHFGENASKQIASTGANMESMRTDIMQLKGQVATLRVGVITGQLPDAKEGEDSIAKSFSAIEDRIAALEASQLDMLKLLDKLQGKTTKNTKPAGLKTADEFHNAFSKKQFTKITEDYPLVVKKLSVKSKDYFEIGYLNAESLFKLGNIRKSALAYNELYKELKKVDAHEIAQAATIQKRLGDCFRLLGDKKTALVFYKELQAKYHDSNEASEAKDLMEKLE